MDAFIEKFMGILSAFCKLIRFSVISLYFFKNRAPHYLVVLNELAPKSSLINMTTSDYVGLLRNLVVFVR